MRLPGGPAYHALLSFRICLMQACPATAVGVASHGTGELNYSDVARLQACRFFRCTLMSPVLLRAYVNLIVNSRVHLLSKGNMQVHPVADLDAAHASLPARLCE